MRIEVPTCTAGRPDGARHASLYPSVVGILDTLADLDGRQPVLVDSAQRVHEVVQVCLHHEHHRGVPNSAVRADEDEQVRETGDRRTLVGLHAVGAPNLAERAPASTSASTSRTVPSRVTIALPRTSAMPSFTSDTFARSSIGYQSLDSRMRLHPIWNFGVTASRSAGSVMPRAMLALAMRRIGADSLRLKTKPSTTASRPQ